MAREQRFEISPGQALKLVLLMPPIALYLLIKTCILRLLLIGYKPPAGGNRDPSCWDVVCVSHVLWPHVWQRNHHTMALLARRSKVLYVNPMRLDTYAKHAAGEALRCHKVRENLWHYETFIFPFETLSPLFQRLNRFLLETRIRYRLKQLGFGPFVLWFYFPAQSWLAGRLGERAIVYDIQDEYSLFRWAPRDVSEKEKRLLAEADVVFAGTDALYERKRPLARNIHFFGCGVDADHFGNLYARDVPHDVRDLRGEVTLGYFGAIDERLDRELLRYLVRQRPNWNLILIGPVWPRLFEPFAAPNVVFTGQRPYELLPRYLRLFDVCLMPFAINDLTRHINPTKALEYFASGKPVVSTPIPDMVKYYSDVIYFAETPEEFLAECERCLREFPAERRERGICLAREKSWDTIVADMRKLIDAAIAEKSKAVTS